MYINSTSQRCPNKIFRIFLIEDFFHLPPVSTTPVVHLELRISPRIFEKIRNGPTGILRGLGETDTCKKPKVENLVALSGTVPPLTITGLRFYVEPLVRSPSVSLSQGLPCSPVQIRSPPPPPPQFQRSSADYSQHHFYNFATF